MSSAHSVSLTEKQLLEHAIKRAELFSISVEQSLIEIKMTLLAFNITFADEEKTLKEEKDKGEAKKV